MGKQIVKAEPVQVALDTSEGRRQQMLRDSQKMYANGIMLGWKSNLYKAAAIHNVKMNKLHEIEGLTWDKYLEAIGLPLRSAQRFERIAKRIGQMVCTNNGTTVGPAFITQKDINDTFAPFFSSGIDLTLRGLSDASANLDNFISYLNGDDSKEKLTVKYLESNNERSEEDEQKEALRERVANEMREEHNTVMRIRAGEKGYKWDAKKNRFLTPEGKDLDESQLSELVDESDGMKVWGTLSKKLAHTAADVYRTIETEGHQFSLFNERAENKQRREANEYLKTIKHQISVIEDMCNALRRGDLEAAKKFYREGPIV